MFGLPASTLRYYEEAGILTDVARTASGQRIYTDGHVARLKTIRCFKGTGMSIAKLQEFFQYEKDEAGHIDDILALLNGQKEQVLRQLAGLNADLEHVNRKIRYYSDIKKAVKSGEPHPKWSGYKEKSASEVSDDKS